MDQSPAPSMGTPGVSPGPQQQQQQQQQQQPIVRVMRLYKPGMHTISSFVHSAPLSSNKHSPALGALSSSSASSREAGYLSDFAISPFLLLPDSFGDIYMGETFSAYVAVVNGLQDTPFHHVSLTLRLLATNATYDLLDTRPADGSPDSPPSSSNSSSGNISRSSSGSALLVASSPSPQDHGSRDAAGRTLEPNAFIDTVVRHTLTEPGTHTLRVSVQYCLPAYASAAAATTPTGRPGASLSPGPGQGLPPSGSGSATSELKTLRKFYRFNVLQPLVVTSTCLDCLGLGSGSGSGSSSGQGAVQASSSGALVVQVRVTNSTQSAVFLEEVEFVPAAAGDLVEPVVLGALGCLGGRSGGAVRAEGEGAGSELDPESWPLLQPGESYALSFRLTKPAHWRASATQVSSLQRGPVGQPVVSWCSYMGERGQIKGEPTFLAVPAAPPQESRRSSLGGGGSTPTGPDGRKRAASGSAGSRVTAPGTGLSLLSLDCPSSVVVGREFSVSLLCKNHTAQPVALYLQSTPEAAGAVINASASAGAGGLSYYNSSSNGLCVTGLTGSARGVLQPGEAVQLSVTIFALACGLFEVGGLAAVDKTTGAVYPAGCLGRVLVVDDEDA